jgi:hypothetical protein
MREQFAMRIAVDWAERLGLGWWEITVVGVNAEALDDGVTPQVIYDGDVCQATIHVALQCDDNELEQRIIHELCHILLVDIVNACDVVRGLLGAEARAMWDEVIERAQERAVVRLARGVQWCGVTATASSPPAPLVVSVRAACGEGSTETAEG